MCLLVNRHWQKHLFLNRIDIAQVANLRLYTDEALLVRVPVIAERTDRLWVGAALNSKAGFDAVISSLEGIVPHLENLIKLKRIHVIRNGSDVASYQVGEKERFGFGPEDVIIGSTSRLAGGKNILILIRAIIELRKEKAYQHIRLVICGGDTAQEGAPLYLNNSNRRQSRWEAAWRLQDKYLTLQLLLGAKTLPLVHPGLIMRAFQIR